jgi:D-3-phosphoglycerate dehydrogenase
VKALFIDCNDQLAPVFGKMFVPATDHPVAVNLQPRVPAEDLPKLLDGVAIAMDDHSYLPTEWVKQCPALRHVVFLGTGAASYMNIDELAALGVTVHTIKGYGDTAVAEHAFALMWAAARQIPIQDRLVRQGVWRSLPGPQLTGKILGLVGLGGIGAEMARLGAGIGMTVQAWNRSPRQVAGVAMVDLDTLLATSDVVSVHLLLGDETRGFLSAECLKKLKDGAIVVNTARGAVFDEPALVAELATGRISAGLDVFDAEPLAADHALTRLDNVVLSAHCAFRTPEASETLIRRALDIVNRIARG